MIQECTSIILFFQVSILPVKTNDIPNYNQRQIDHIKPYAPALPTNKEWSNKRYCFFANKWLECKSNSNLYDSITRLTKKIFDENAFPFHDYVRSFKRTQEYPVTLTSVSESAPPMSRRMYITIPKIFRPMFDGTGTMPHQKYPLYRPGPFNQMSALDIKHYSVWGAHYPRPHVSSGISSAAQFTRANSSSNIIRNRLPLKPPPTLAVSDVHQQIVPHKNMLSIEEFTQSLDNFERQFYKVTFTKLTAISPVDRQENGMSFVQSSFFLLLTLMAISKDVDFNTRSEIDHCIGFKLSDMDNVGVIKHFISNLPKSSDTLKLRQSSRLMLWPKKEWSSQYLGGSAEAAALKLQVDKFNGTETSEKITTILNQKVELDSGGAIHDTFEEDDVSGGVTAILLTTLYVRGRWRAAPTMLNGTRPFHDADDAPKRDVRMIKINDIMQYADLSEWDAQAIEISYATPGLTVLMLIPRSNSLKKLVQHVSSKPVGEIIARMKSMRVAAILPIYTLRMTLLLPNKLQAMGIQKLLEVSDTTQTSYLRLSHAVQRIMFWAEAGRNAFKDDGIEWDQTPELEVVADRPYIFFVRWRNITLLNGHFVL
uniref:Serpin domain-containing protein n=1 Tax=Heliothis virescens TaxID=7102 RepID=A0A2A4JR61_HELVI